MFMVPRQFSMVLVLMTMHLFSLLKGDDNFSITSFFLASGFV